MRHTASTQLALRVVAGTGRAGALRGAVLVVAMAVAVAAGLVIAFVPATATHRDDVAAARAVRPAVPPADESFRAQALDASVGDRQLRRTYIAADGSDPAPPGIDAPPGPGDVYASPELVSLMRRKRFVASFVPGEVVGTISAEGLTDPGELFAYIGVADGADLTAASGFGGRGNVEGTGSGLLAVQLSLFVLVPACGFLVVSSTLSSRARGRRWDAMRSLSVPETVVRHVAGVETGLTSLAGGVLGLALFAVVRRPLTGAGVGGLRWFPQDLRLTPAIAMSSLLVVASAGTLLGRRATRVASADTLHQRQPKVPSGLRWLPLICGMAVLTAIGIVHGTGRIINSAPILLGGALLAALGLGLMLVPIVHASGTLVATRSRRLAWRLGGSRAAYEPRSVVRMLAGLVALTIIGHVTFAVLADLRLVVGDQREQIIASTSVSDHTAADVEQLLHLGPQALAFAHSISRGPGGATIAYAECSTLSTLISTTAPCRQGHRYRMADKAFPSDLSAGQRYEIETREGPPIVVTAPNVQAVDLVGMFGTSTLLIATPPPTDQAAFNRVQYLLDRRDLLELQAGVDALDPGLIVDSSVEPEQIERYEHHLAIARLGATLGGLLATLTFLVASVDRLLERRSHTATLVAIGVPRRTLRTSQIAQLVLPVTAALLAANLVGWLIAQGYLAFGGLMAGIPIGLLTQGLALSAASVAIAAAAGAIVSVPKDIVTHLRAE